DLVLVSEVFEVLKGFRTVDVLQPVSMNVGDESVSLLVVQVESLRVVVDVFVRDVSPVRSVVEDAVRVVQRVDLAERHDEIAP
ncbi:hypothetical protein AAHH80_36005, partial [Burkholderia pseudomallei]